MTRNLKTEKRKIRENTWNSHLIGLIPFFFFIFLGYIIDIINILHQGMLSIFVSGLYQQTNGNMRITHQVPQEVD